MEITPNTRFSLDQFDEGQLRMCQNGYRTNPPSLKKHAVPSLKSPDRPPDFFSKPAVQQSWESWDTDSIQSTSQQIRESMEAKIAKEKEEAKARQVRKAERKARKLGEADKAKELEVQVEVETAPPPSSASSTITMSTLSMPLPAPVPLPMTDDDPADYPSSSPSSATPTPAPAFNTSCFAGASRAPSTDTPVIRSPLLVLPRPKRRSATVTSWTEDGIPIKRRRRSFYQREKEFQNIAEAYKKAATKEKEQQDAVSVNTNDEVFQTGPQMAHRRVQVKVRMHSFGSQVTPKSFVRSRGTQTEMQRTMVLPNHHVLVDASAQTDASNAGPTCSTCKGEPVAREEEPGIADDEDPVEPPDFEREDPTWQPPDSFESDSSSDESCSEHEDIYTYDNVHDMPKYIVFEENLLELFRICRKCSGPCDVEKFRPKVFGSQIKIVSTCNCCGHEHAWHSQPKIGNFYAGNISLSASILFAGASPTQTLKVLNHLNLVAISNSCFLDHQRSFLWPVIKKVWERRQNQMLQELAPSPIVLGGDGRADSPGHCAKYGSYSLMNLKTGKIVDVQLVQSNEVTSSNAMELEGLKRAMTRLTEAGITVERLVTDRHPSVQKYMREQHPDVDHRYDVWHIAKGVKKNIKAVAKQPDCEQAGLWQRSIVNHIYWSAASTPDGNPEVIQTKYKSILNHVQDIHIGHGHEMYDQCAHGPLDRPRVWLKPDSKVYDKLSEVLLKTRLLNDVKKMSPQQQTSNLEAYHSVLLYWCPKLLAFSYEGMKCRLLLSALHWNENGGRAQALKADGTPIYKINYPKAKPKGSATLAKVLSAPTYGYVTELMAETIKVVKEGARDVRDNTSPKPLTADLERPSKEDMLAALGKHSRFARLEERDGQ